MSGEGFGASESRDPLVNGIYVAFVTSLVMRTSPPKP